MDGGIYCMIHHCIMLYFCEGFFSAFICDIAALCAFLSGSVWCVSVACAKLVCHSHFYWFNLLWSHFHVAAHAAFVLRMECEDERWQQSLVDSVTVFIQLDSDVASEDSRCKRGCQRMKSHVHSVRLLCVLAGTPAKPLWLLIQDLYYSSDRANSYTSIRLIFPWETLVEVCIQGAVRPEIITSLS